MKISDFELTSISFSATIDPSTQHDFANIHHGFLSLKEFVPDNWVVKKADFTHSSSSLEYENGVHLTGDPREFQVEQTDGLKIEEDSTALRLMIQYLTSISPNTFRLMGVQLDLQARHQDPNGWLIEKFISSDFSAHGWKQVQPVLMLSTPIENMMVTFAFLTGQEVVDEHSSGLLRVTIHAFHEPFSSSEEAVKWCYEWGAHKKTILQNLAKLVENDNDKTKN